MSYSQDHEDEIVLDYFKSLGIGRGYFLDIGASDFRTISNTRLLAESGWKGLLVEPHYHFMPMLLEETKIFPNVCILNAAVSAQPKINTFYDAPKEKFISTISMTLAMRGHEREGSRHFSVMSCTPTDIYNAYGYFDFISIDAEGLSVEILNAIPFDEMKPICLCVEFFGNEVLGSEHTEEAILEIASRNGYRHLKTTKENVICVR